MPKIVDTEKSISGEYTRLLVEKRQLDIKEAIGETICRHCGRKKTEHLPDQRCSVYAGSRSFSSRNALRLTTINLALQYFENLFELEVE